MKDFLVDVPVRINIWIRPECQKRQFEVIKKARPSILFIQSDGGRNAEEWKIIKSNRAYIDNNIDWNCKVYRLYEDHNNGMYAMAKKTSELVWKKTDRCIFLEDDQIPSLSYFRFCAELLEKYKDDQRVECICAMNHLGISKNVTSDYFFSRQGAIWGQATWKRCFEDRDYSFSYINDPYIITLLRQRTKHNKAFWKKIIGYGKNQCYDGHNAGGEFWYEFNMYSQYRLHIIPKYNMMKNIGFSDNAAHAKPLDKMPKGIRKIFNMKTYELDFPLNHPKYVIPDVLYEKKRNRIMGYNYPMVKLFRGLENLKINFFSGNIRSYILSRKNRKQNITKMFEK